MTPSLPPRCTKVTSVLLGTTIASPSGVGTETTSTTRPGSDPFAGLDRINVLLMGGDSGVDREGIRTDTMIVVSVDPTTGYTAMFSVPRNNINVPFPETLPAYNAYPECNCYPALLNLLYGWAFDHPELFPGSSNPGGVAMKETIGNLLGGTKNQRLDEITLAQTFVNYPLEMQPIPPAEVMPTTWRADTFGFYVFRSGWQGRDDFVAQVFLKAAPIVGWNHPNAASFQVYGGFPPEAESSCS